MTQSLEKTKKMSFDRLVSFIMGLKRLLRHFPYTEMLVLFLPIYVFAFNKNIFTGPESLLMVVPFIFLFSVGFVYNDILDQKDPKSKKNPLLTGEVSIHQAKVILVIALLGSLTSFMFLYHAWISWLVYLIYLFLCFAYSGIQIRIKETLFGPFVAGFIVWIAGPIILVLELGLLNHLFIIFFLGVWLVYCGREIYHTILDHDEDKKSGYETFAVRLRPKVRYLIKGLIVLSGYVLLFIFTWQILPRDVSLFVLPLTLLLIAMVLEILADIQVKFIDGKWTYLFARIFLVSLSIVLLNLNLFITAIFFWLFFTSKRS